MINVHCYDRGETSYAVHAIGFCRALNRRHPVSIVPLDGYGSPYGLPGDIVEMRQRTHDPSAPSIGIAPIDFLGQVQGGKRIALVVWETTIVHPPKMAMLRTMDEVWTPSHWGRQTFINNGLDADRVKVVPEGVDADKYTPPPATRKEGRFRFLCVGKWEHRKAIDQLVDAFAEEFHPREAVELVMHCSNPWIRGFDLPGSIARALRGRPARVIASQPVPSLLPVYHACDAFVLPTRGEGWGLPIVEAMACGLPVIVTNYSAPADYLNDEIAYPIRVEKLVDVHDPIFFPEGAAAGQWAQPDLAHLRALMRHVFEHQDEAREKGRLAREAICNRWTWDHAAAKALTALGMDA